MTSSKLPAQLQSIKRKLGLTLIKFEDASVDLKPFVKNHSFESSKFFVHSILKHYKDVSNMSVTNSWNAWQGKFIFCIIIIYAIVLANLTLYVIKDNSSQCA
jgi:hypothetical protein